MDDGGQGGQQNVLEGADVKLRVGMSHEMGQQSCPCMGAEEGSKLIHALESRALAEEPPPH